MTTEARVSRPADSGERNSAPEVEREPLLPAQRIAAEMAYATYVVKAFSQDARDQLPWRKRQEKSVVTSHHTPALFKSPRFDAPRRADQVIQVQHLNGLLDAYADIEKGDGPERVTQWTGYERYLTNRVSDMLPNLTAEKERLFAEAFTWGHTDITRIMKDTRAAIRSLPKDQRSFLEQRANITPKTMKQLLIEWGVPAGGSGVVFVGSEVATAAASSLVSTKTPIVDALPESWRTPVLALAFASTEAYWIKSMWGNVKAQTRLLELDSPNINIFSKLTYSYQERRMAKKGLEDDVIERKKSLMKAVAAGHIGPQGLMELIYGAGVGTAMLADKLDINQSLAICALANAIGIGVEKVSTWGQNRAAARKERKMDKRESEQ